MKASQFELDERERVARDAIIRDEERKIAEAEARKEARKEARRAAKKRR
jgi:hypothetical protein